MTSKEKAEELVERYADVLPSVFYNSEEAKNYPRAKACALIAVDEIINEYFEIRYRTNGSNLRLPFEYWESVKEEIGYL
jgi:hypothetical protein